MEPTTAVIVTRNRYNTTLATAIASVVNQTVKPQKLIIVDDGEFKDLRSMEPHGHLLNLLLHKGINWDVLPGGGQGLAKGFHLAFNKAETEWIWRLDDDNMAEPDVLEKLLAHASNKEVGGVAGMAWIPYGVAPNGFISSSKIKDIFFKLNAQMFGVSSGQQEIEHFHNTFLFRKSAADLNSCLDLSPVSHREDTIFSYSILRNGFKLVLEQSAVTWHLKSPNGGIRTFSDGSLWAHDEEIFKGKLKSWGITPEKYKLIIVPNGKGDNVRFRALLPEIMDKYSDHHVVIGTPFMDVFSNIRGIKPDQRNRLHIIHQGEAMHIDSDLGKFNVYNFIQSRGLTISITEGYRRMYL